MKIYFQHALLLFFGLASESCIVVAPSLEIPAVNGVVLEATGKKPVAGAAVTVATFSGVMKARGITAPDGRFTFPAIRRWQVYLLMGGDTFYSASISVEHDGYLPQTVRASAFGKPDALPFQTILLKNSPDSWPAIPNR